MGWAYAKVYKKGRKHICLAAATQNLLSNQDMIIGNSQFVSETWFKTDWSGDKCQVKRNWKWMYFIPLSEDKGWRQGSGGKALETSVWRQVYGDKSFIKGSGDKFIEARVCMKGSGDKRVWRQEGPKTRPSSALHKSGGNFFAQDHLNSCLGRFYGDH